MKRNKLMIKSTAVGLAVAMAATTMSMPGGLMNPTEVLQLLNPRLDIALLVLGSIVLGILRQVTLLSRLFDLLRHFLTLYNFEVMELILILFESLIR